MLFSSSNSHLKVHNEGSRNKKNFDLDQKVSPRMHKLADSQCSHLPAQSYLRFDKRLMTSSISQQSYERSKNYNSSSSFRALNSVSNLINSSQDSFTQQNLAKKGSQQEIQKSTREKSDVKEYRSNHKNDENSVVVVVKTTKIPGFNANDLSNLTNERKQTENDNFDGFTTFRKDSQRESFEISPINSTKSVLAPLQNLSQNQKCNSVSNTTPRNFQKRTEFLSPFSVKKNSLDSFRQDNRIMNNLKNFDRETLKKILFNMVNENKKRDTVLFDLVNRKSSIKDERANLDLGLTQMLAQKKKSEDALEQVNHQINCQIRESAFLKKCQTRLESILPGPEDRCQDLDSVLKKTQENEDRLIEKEREGMMMKKAIQEFEKTKGTFFTQDEQEKNQTQIKRIELELKIRQREIKQLTFVIEGIKLKMLQEKEAEEKLLTLEKTQDLLITENNKLKNQLSQEQQKIFETKHLNKRVVLKVYQNSEYLDFVKNSLNHILKIAEKGIKHREISDHEIQLFKKALQQNKTHKLDANSVTQANVKVFIKKNLISTKEICKEFVTWMNKICEEFAQGYENHHFDFVFNRNK